MTIKASELNKLFELKQKSEYEPGDKVTVKEKGDGFVVDFETAPEGSVLIRFKDGKENIPIEDIEGLSANQNKSFEKKEKDGDDLEDPKDMKDDSEEKDGEGSEDEKKKESLTLCEKFNEVVVKSDDPEKAKAASDTIPGKGDTSNTDDMEIVDPESEK